MAKNILLIGCGNMGYAMLKGWQNKQPDLNYVVIEPNKVFRDRAKNIGATAFEYISQLPKDQEIDLVFIAVKPQMVADILHHCHDLANGGATFISIAAGVTTQTMTSALPPLTPIIRCMPNTPAAISQGMMVVFKNDNVKAQHAKLTENLLSTSGSVSWINDEKQMDAVTAISGSGPAYFFLFIEALSQAGQQLGLDEQTALLLAKQTAAGAGAMALESDISPSELRKNVTSPNGTTAAALEVFMSCDNLQNLVYEATQAAYNRSIELGKNNS